MSVLTNVPAGRCIDSARLSEPGYQPFLLLRTVVTITPIVFGIDQQGMYIVGAVEIIAGIVVALAPRLGGLLVAAWLAGIILSLLTIPGFYAIALCDFGLLVAALAVLRLATDYTGGHAVR